MLTQSVPRRKLTLLGDIYMYVEKLSKPMLKVTLPDEEEAIRPAGGNCGLPLPHPASYHIGL